MEKLRMMQLRKMVLWFVGIIGILMVLAAAAALIIPRTALMQTIDKRINDEFRIRTGYELQYKSLRFSLLPSPRLVFQDPLISSPGKFNLSMKSLEIIPSFFALLRGKGRIASIHCNAPEVNLQLQFATGSEAPQETIATHLQAQANVAEFLASLAVRLPDLKITVTNGKFNLFEGTKPRFQFKNIHGNVQLSPDHPRVNVQCKSDLFDSISLDASLYTRDLKSQGKMVLTRLTPHKLTDYFFPSATCQVERGETNLEVTFESDGPRTIRSQFKGSIPSLTLCQNNEVIVLKAGAFEGYLNNQDDQLEVVFSRLQFDAPAGSLTARYFRDGQGPVMRLDLDGHDIDAAALRKVLLALGGNNEAITKVFDIIRAGSVPHITFEIQGTSLEDLKKLDHMVIRGNMVGGTIVVPNIELEVQEAKGDVFISESVLHGSGLEGRAGASLGRQGTLVVGLKKEVEHVPFHLDIALDADLVQLPPILERVVKNGPFLREMRLMQNIQGRATGRLLLGESLDDVKTDLDISSFRISAHYQRLPFPFDIQGGTFAYHGEAVSVQSAGGSLGKSSFSDMSVRVQWEGKPTIDIRSSGKIRVDLNELYPWLITHATVRDFLKNFESMNGILLIDSTNLKGPILQPKDWVFQARGKVENFLMKSSFLPESLAVKQGRVEADQDRLSFYDCSARILDAVMVMSGALEGYTKGLRTATLTLQGDLDEKSNSYISNLIDLPDVFKLRSPLHFSQAQFAWKRGGETSFSAQMTPKNGPTVDLEVMREPDALTIKNIAIKDSDSNASLSLLWSKGQFDLSFDGELRRASVDRLLARNSYFTGALRGNFETQFSLAAPLQSQAKGKLHIEGFQYKGDLRQPADIIRADIEAADSQIHIQSSKIVWAGSTINSQGNVGFSTRGFLLNLDVSADALDWEQLRHMKEERPNTKRSETPPGTHASRKITLQGILNVKADQLIYENLKWSDVSATVSLQGDESTIDFKKANLCGIPTPGTIQLSAQKTRLQVKPDAKNVDFPSTLSCLWDKDGLITGLFDLKGDLKASGTEQDLLRTLAGDLEFKASKGRIYRMGLLAKILSVINITEIYRGKFPDLTEEGFAYDSIEAEGTLADGKLTLKKGLIDGPYLKMAWRGSMDLENKTLDFTVLVSPLRTVDRIVTLIPLVGKALGGSLIAFPVQVSGNMEDPSVIPLSPSAIGSGLFGFMERTFKLPIVILKPFL